MSNLVLQRSELGCCAVISARQPLPLPCLGRGGRIYKRRREAEKIVTLPRDPHSEALALNPHNVLWCLKSNIQEIQLDAHVVLMAAKSARQVPKGSLPSASTLPSPHPLRKGSARKASLRSLRDPLPKHPSSFPRRKEITVGDFAYLRQLSDCFPQVRGKEQPACEWGGWGPTRERSPPPLCACKKGHWPSRGKCKKESTNR